MYCQCRMQKRCDTGLLVRVAWIPEPYCLVGKVLRLRDRGESWSDGWEVMEIGRPREEPPDYRKLIYTCPELR